MKQWPTMLLGDIGVGKTALNYQFLLSSFTEEYDPTLEDCYRKQVVVDNEPCIVEVIDPPGEAEFVTWIRDSQGFLLVYSLTSRASFSRLDALWQSARRINGDQAPVILLGNKCDKASDRAVPTEEGAALARHFGCPFLEVSAQTGQNVDRAFADLVRLMRGWKAEATANQVQRKKRKCVVL
ncbi:P-loop containing nucleoside triphosphate hydrolase protein [Mycena latifolia]|nr:P-loop containing nucleoside triphosphate hydrolase protein [Mycena latifolia]